MQVSKAKKIKIIHKPPNQGGLLNNASLPACLFGVCVRARVCAHMCVCFGGVFLKICINILC